MVVRESKLVVVVSGSIGFEALVCGKPLIIIGNAPFQILPKNMIRTIEGYRNLSREIEDLLSSYAHDEDALEKYVAAVIETGVPVNFYSDLLKRAEAYNKNPDRPGNDFEIQIDHLAKYLINKRLEHQELSPKKGPSKVQ